MCRLRRLRAGSAWSSSGLNLLLPRLMSRGFPPSDPDTGNYDLEAIDAWRAARHRRLLPSVSNTEHAAGVVKARLGAMRG